MDGQLSARLIRQLKSEGVDMNAMQQFLCDLNAGKFARTSPVQIAGVPSAMHPDIVDRASLQSYAIPRAAAAAKFRELDLPFQPESLAVPEDGNPDILRFPRGALARIGTALYPKAAFGILNGGSASSYADEKKNRSLCPEVFSFYRAHFGAVSDNCKGRPKGITPAYFNPDGSPGASFLFLKLRMLLERKADYAAAFGALPEGILPAFQMTSVKTDGEIRAFLNSCRSDPDLLALSVPLRCAPLEMYTEVQPMMAALTHSADGLPRRIFDRAYGEKDRGLAFPGGHGQNFAILAPVYRRLARMGVRYVWLGNIDNLGYTVDPVSLAVFALSGRDAAFETSFKTPMDVKGGLLVVTGTGRITCADIGPAVSPEQMEQFSQEGGRLLFNCAIGLFDLQRLLPMLDSLPYRLPLRITDQDKDAGRYAQAEQLTWEIIGLLEKPLFFAVEKKKRFIASKMILENLLTSLPDWFASEPGFAGTPLHTLSLDLHAGLHDLLSQDYGMQMTDGVWRFAGARASRAPC